MNDFDKCNFCESMTDAGYCTEKYLCQKHSLYCLDVNKILDKADKLHISVTDVLNLIRECNK